MEEKKDYCVIVCENLYRYIGKGGRLMYKIKEDMDHFKAITCNNVVIMGRKTFESLPKREPLPRRVNIILTSKTDYTVETESLPRNTDVIIAHSIEEIDQIVQEKYPDKTCFVIGGSEVYKQYMERNKVSMVYLTLVADCERGDVQFPDLPEEIWYEKSADWNVDEKTNLQFRFETFKLREVRERDRKKKTVNS